MRFDVPLFVLRVFVVLFFAYVLAPILVVVVVSFTSAGYIGFPLPGLSLRWFWRIVDYSPFMDALLVSLALGIASTLCACALGVPAALALARRRGPRADALATFVLAPLSMPQIVLGFALLFYLSALGFGTSFTALLVAHTIVGIPYIVRTVAGVFRGLPPDFEEAAAVLGADRWQVFWHVTLPLIRPGIFAGALFAILISLDNLPVSYFFGSATTNTLPVVMLSYLENQFDPSIAAISTLQMLLAVGALLIVERLYGLKHMNAPA
jgi:putative spermidine/putrescine transport system permease protein